MDSCMAMQHCTPAGVANITCLLMVPPLCMLSCRPVRMCWLLARLRAPCSLLPQLSAPVHLFKPLASRLHEGGQRAA